MLYYKNETDKNDWLSSSLSSPAFWEGLAASTEPLVFVQDDVDEAEEEISAGECADGSAPWYLRVQELAHDSLIAATRAELAKEARASSNSNILFLHHSLLILSRCDLLVMNRIFMVVLSCNIVYSHTTNHNKHCFVLVQVTTFLAASQRGQKRRHHHHETVVHLQRRFSGVLMITANGLLPTLLIWNTTWKHIGRWRKVFQELNTAKKWNWQFFTYRS